MYWEHGLWCYSSTWCGTRLDCHPLPSPLSTLSQRPGEFHYQDLMSQQGRRTRQWDPCQKGRSDGKPFTTQVPIVLTSPRWPSARNRCHLSCVGACPSNRVVLILLFSLGRHLACSHACTGGPAVFRVSRTVAPARAPRVDPRLMPTLA